MACEGSIQWAMDRGTLYQVDGVHKCGRLVTGAECSEEAAQIAVDGLEGLYCAWLPAGTQLTVWRVTGGSTGGFHLALPIDYFFFQGEVLRADKVALEIPFTPHIHD